MSLKRIGPAAGMALLMVMGATYIGLQIWLAVEYTKTSSVVLRELRESKDPNFDKTREEAIALRIENERRTLFWTALSANISAAVGVMLAVFAAWMSFRQFLQTRDRERLDRAATELNAIWQGLTGEKPEVRASSVASLQQFLSPDRAEYHSRVVAALALSARTEEALVTRTATTVIEYAFRHVELEVLRSVSWRGVRAPEANLEGVVIDGLDLREAVLDGASLRGASLIGCRLARASLVGTDLHDANLTRSDLEGADLTKSIMRNALLAGANLTRAKLLRADLHGATLREARLPADEAVRAARNWRAAIVDEDVKARLREQFGPVASPPRVLMVMWEFPPFVTGGAWTAAFHLVNELRRAGRDITVLVPWPQSLVDESVFGGEVEVIGVGSEELLQQKGREYFYSGYSGYSSGAPERIRVQRDIEGVGIYFSPEPSLMRLVSDFRTNTAEAVRERELRFDVVHAHDWMAIDAALPLVSDGVPLVAHIHSTEADRRERPSTRIAAIERTGCLAASTIVAPSARLMAAVAQQYSPSAKLAVVPNTAGEPRFIGRGQYGPGRVIFLGRITWQKGTDLFVRIANEVRRDVPHSEFLMFGDGDRVRETAELIDSFRPAAGWKVRVSYGDFLIEFDRVRQVRFDPNTRQILPEAPGELLLRDPATITKEIGGQECEIVPVQGFKHFTHRFTLPFRPLHFLVQTDVLPTYDAVPDRFVVLAGNLEWGKRHSAFDEASVVVVPSRSEPFGMTILEAMLSGVPVVTTDVAGALEFVEVAATFPVGDPAAGAAAVTRLLNDETAWLAAVDRQRRSAEAFVQSRPHAQIDALWRSLAARP